MLAACGSDVADSLGYGKSPPDEFTVISRPPLILPPDYNLRPPGSGTARTTALKPNEIAKILVLGKENKPTEKNTTGDSIREQIENDRTGTVSKSPETVETLVRDSK